MAIEIGSTVNGVIIKVADYGAIVRLAGGKMGLVHISEVAETFVRDVRDFLKEDDRILVKVLRLNDKGRYELSIKQADKSIAPEKDRKENTDSRNFASDGDFTDSRKAPCTFEERLNRFMKESENRLSDLKKHIEGKRGGRRK